MLAIVQENIYSLGWLWVFLYDKIIKNESKKLGSVHCLWSTALYNMHSFLKLDPTAVNLPNTSIIKSLGPTVLNRAVL